MKVDSDPVVPSFWQRGYAAFPSFLDQQDVVRLRGLCDALIERPIRQRGIASEGLVWLFQPEDEVPDLLRGRSVQRAWEVAARLAQPVGHLSRMSSRLFYKPASFGYAIPWHQDRAYSAADSTSYTITCWLALDDVSEQNGCLVYAPGSCAGGIVPHRRCRSGVGEVVLEADHDGPAVSVPLSAGGCVFHSDLVLHQSGPNRSLSPRRALALKFDVQSDQPH
jgi:phytanoyl-CoA hydroxylase